MKEEQRSSFQHGVENKNTVKQMEKGEEVGKLIMCRNRVNFEADGEEAVKSSLCLISEEKVFGRRIYTRTSEYNVFLFILCCLFVGILIYIENEL
jgi:hypothetical protein